MCHCSNDCTYVYVLIIYSVALYQLAVLSYPGCSGKEYGTPVMYVFLLFSFMIGKTCVVYIYDF